MVNLVNLERLIPHSRLPLLVTPRNGAMPLLGLAQLERGVLDTLLLEHGALLFRGFADSVAQFGSFIDAISSTRLSYEYRSTPRTSLGDNVYTASVYPQHRHIPLHCENSYQRDWPMLIAFCCAQNAVRGGETPIADMTRVTARIPADLLARFREQGVCYQRYYRPGVDLPWEEVFQTRDPVEVARYCREHGIEHQWHGSAELSTTQRCHGTATHPVSGSEVFFNQAHLFHASSLGDELEQEMRELFGPGGLPRDARYGDGREISRTDLAHVRAAFDAEAIAFPWQTGDVLLLDNMQVAHGRRPYEGAREVRVAMSNPYSRSKR